MDQLLAAEGVAGVLNVEKGTVLRFIDSGELPSVRVGDVVRVRPADLEAFVERLAEKQALERLARTLSDPRVWAESLEESPELKARPRPSGWRRDTRDGAGGPDGRRPRGRGDRWLISFMDFDLGHYDFMAKRFVPNGLPDYNEVTPIEAANSCT